MRIRTIALAGAATFALSAPALADHVGWYLGLGAGFEESQSTGLELPPDPIFGFPPVHAKERFSGSGIYLADAGYKWTDGFRFEGEIAFKNPNAKVALCEGRFCETVGRGGKEVYTLMANFIYDWNLGEGWGISLGGGIGAGDVNEFVKAPGPACAICGGQWGAAYQGIAGVYFELGDDWDLSAEYRYRGEWIDHDYRTAFNSGITEIDKVHMRTLQEHAGIIAIKYYLGQKPPPPPPPPPPAPPPPPPPPPAVKTFIVFFDFDKSNLTAEAQSVVSEAVKTAKQNGFVKVMVTGHTDTVGSDRYNQALSERRADAVKDEMVRQGMDGNSISVAGKSFHDPLVPTGPGVREPQNRRAVIELGGGAGT